ncbi:hypothetical protein [Thermotalea metallivorans]|uniref:Uncharacterized protein n=1 Tax=Thermotalea metallivorans TaxID=520762 RepID=A0A140L2M9_9FIRM|nr:hypothetical protein [Thermotalea metallivorans]KXG74804.1 hypothetical protein AN619_21450 [Thermotalea metallivorans]
MTKKERENLNRVRSIECPKCQCDMILETEADEEVVDVMAAIECPNCKNRLEGDDLKHITANQFPGIY